MLTTQHTLHSCQHHHGWDHSIEPVRAVAPGQAILFETIDSSGGQITPDSTAAALGELDFARVNPVTGPVFVEGAEPGDAIEIELLEFQPRGWGWTALIPGFGLLADQFPEPALRQWRYDFATGGPAAWGSQACVPVRPFVGTIGLAPAEPGLHGVLPPRRVGGNMDVRDLAAGATLWLPVEVPGGLLSLGDTHAAQGDGEVCGTAIESPMDLVLRIGLVKGGAPRFPRIRTTQSTGRLSKSGFEITTGIGPDLHENARAAVSQMIELLAQTQKVSAEDAYMLISACGDLRIAEIVDAPNWVVSLQFPRSVFD